METKEVDIEWEGKPEKVTIKKLSYGEVNSIQDAAVSVKVHEDGSTDRTLSIKMLKEQALFYGIVKAPFKVSDLSVVQSLPPTVGHKLYDEVNGYNSIDVPKKGT